MAPLLERVKSGSRCVGEWEPGGLPRQLRMHETTGRPLGDEKFVARLEKRLGGGRWHGNALAASPSRPGGEAIVRRNWYDVP